MSLCGWRQLRQSNPYKGKKKVIGRVAGQMLSLIYGLLKRDQEVLSQTPAGQQAPDPILYDAARHKTDREGGYRSRKKVAPQGALVHLA